MVDELLLGLHHVARNIPFLILDDNIPLLDAQKQHHQQFRKPSFQRASVVYAREREGLDELFDDSDEVIVIPHNRKPFK